MPSRFAFFTRLAALACLAAVLGGCASPSSPSMARSSEGAAPAPATARAGLGTGWGEYRHSASSSTTFARASRTPAGTDRIYYNDLQGVEDVRESARFPVRRTSAVQEVSSAQVAWGLKGGGLSTYWIDGSRLVAGRKGSRYEIELRNLSDRRVEAVVSVDGLDVIDGRPASLGKPGYILQPHQTVRIDGFRTSSRSVAAFRFSSVSHSYANLRHGNTRNVGVVGLAVFPEASYDPGQQRFAQPPNDPELARRRRADPFPGR